MKHFFTPGLRVFNAVTAQVDPAIAQEFAPLLEEPLDYDRFDLVRPDAAKWNSDIHWISAKTPDSFKLFESAFQRSGIPERVAPYLSLDQEVRLYFGCIIVRSHCQRPYFHLDWEHSNNEAFTALMPLTENCSDFGLLYQAFDGKTQDYPYRLGEAIVFGDHFRHSTKPGRSDTPAAILSFAFGTDRMEHWDTIFGYIGKQARLFRRPDGSFLRLADDQRAALG